MIEPLLFQQIQSVLSDIPSTMAVLSALPRTSSLGIWTRTVSLFTLRRNMGLLSLGTPLSWDIAKQHANHVRSHGIKLFLNIYAKVKDRQRDCLAWGDEIEYCRVRFDDAGKQTGTARVCFCRVMVVDCRDISRLDLFRNHLGSRSTPVICLKAYFDLWLPHRF